MNIPTPPRRFRHVGSGLSSLSALVGAIAERHGRTKTDLEWKEQAFRNQADGAWDANGSPVESFQETQ